MSSGRREGPYEIAPGAIVGFSTCLMENVWLADDVVIGDRCQIAPNAVIGQPGFGYQENDDSTWTYKPHPFSVLIGDDVYIGAGTTIARGRHRHTEIGDGTKVDDQVFIAHNVLIGNDCLIIARAAIAGSVEIGDRTIVGVGATIRDHVTVGEYALIGAGAVVIEDVPDGQVWAGNPARYLRDRREDDLK